MSPVRVLRGCFFGAIGGFLAWMLVEFLPFAYPFRPARYEVPGASIPPSSAEQQALVGIAVGLAIAGLLGLSEGISEGSATRFRRAVLVFLGIGAVGGFMGLYFGQLLYMKLGGNPNAVEGGLAQFFPQLFARTFAWMLIGLFLGLALGVPNLSSRRMMNGAIGGGIGGAVGGAVFQLMAFTGLFVGMQGRLVGFTILGASIGFFLNLVAEASKRVWVRVLIGRNEGREHVLDTPIAYVGRDELAEVPVFLDPALPKRVASFRSNQGRYSLYPETQAVSITVNGQPLNPGQVLRDGDGIQFGRVTLGYYEKSTATGRRPVDSLALTAPGAAGASVPLPTNPNVCEFCGQPRDPATGGCACSVPEGAAPYADPGAGYGPGGALPGSYETPTAYDPGPAPAVAYGDAGPAPHADGPALAVLAGPWAGQIIPLLTADIGIGRDAQQDIALADDSTVSRRHARLTYGEQGWVLRDEGSSNGTWVNGARIQEQPLFPGDVVRIGKSEFRFDG